MKQFVFYNKNIRHCYEALLCERYGHSEQNKTAIRIYTVQMSCLEY